MQRRKWIRYSLTVLTALVIFTPLAVWRAGDLRHVVATANARGGRVRHDVHLEFGRDRYTVLVTGRNRLTETADLQVVVEGEPAIPFSVYSNYPPTIDLGVHDWPHFSDGALKDINPGEKLGLWVVLEPEKIELPAGQFLNPIRYTIALKDSQSFSVLSVPVEFRDPRAHDQAGGGR
jgi:hypothetical protein